MIGKTIAHYEIFDKLGEGGMGVVYRARDTRLGRDVAIKVLPEQLAQDHERMARFEREAHVLAQLNHPNISSIYGLEQSDGQFALVMELVDGSTLADRLDAGPIPAEDALPMARQMAEALSAAHEKGIIHRDLKPANIKVDGEGNVKVLDFGLAKALEGESAVTQPDDSPTLTIAATQAGVILGTAAYMSPEQARGRPVDKRADIWAFGVVLYEMLTGRQLFGGETVSDSLAGVLKTEIDLAALPEGTPAAVRRLLRRCLERDRKKRLHDIADAALEIEECLATPDEEVVTSGPANSGRLPWVLAAALGIGLVVALVAPWRSNDSVKRPYLTFDINLEPHVPLTPLHSAGAILSPDGDRLVFISTDSDNRRRLYTRKLDGGDTAFLPGTEDALQPFFSPDGEWIGFLAGGQLKKISVAGGAVVTLTDVKDVRGCAWAEDGSIILGRLLSGLWRLPAGGSQLELLVEGMHRWPQVLPGGRWVLYTTREAGVDYSDFEHSSLAVLFLETGETKLVLQNASYGRYLPSGHMVYVHEDNLFAAPFDLERMALAESPVPVPANVRWDTADGLAQFDFSRTGVVVYRKAGSGAKPSRIVLVDRAGSTETVLDTPGRYTSLAYSPDGGSMAVTERDQAGAHLWLLDLKRGLLTRLMPEARSKSFNSIVWSPHGSFLVTGFRPEGGYSNLHWASTDGSGKAGRLSEFASIEVPWSYSPDGSHVAFFLARPDTRYDIEVLPIAINEKGEPMPGQSKVYLATEFNEVQPEFSPDGRWLAYTSNESGEREVYVRPFPGPGGKRQISNGGGTNPLWSPDGRELYFRGSDGKLMVVAYEAAQGTFKPEKLEQWSDYEFPFAAGSRTFDITPDGQRFAVIVPVEGREDQEAHDLTFGVNFFDELRRRVPVGGE